MHFHALLFDGVYTRATPAARPRFHRLPPPTDADVAWVLTRLHRRVRRLLIRRGRWPDADRERPVRGAGAVVREHRGRLAAGPGGAGPACRAAGAPSPLGRRRDGRGATLRPAREPSGLEKGSAFYLGSPLFYLKMALFLAIVALEVGPMLTFIRWRQARRRGVRVDTSPARALFKVNHIQLALALVMVFVASAMARGLW